MNLSYKTDRYDIKKLPNQSLAVTQCGLQICNSGHSCGPCLYEHYSVCFILSGKGTYTCGGKTYTLCAGQGFIIIPDVNVFRFSQDARIHVNNVSCPERILKRPEVKCSMNFMAEKQSSGREVFSGTGGNPD